MAPTSLRPGSSARTSTCDQQNTEPSAALDAQLAAFEAR
jgi:hypothetical protein